MTTTSTPSVAVGARARGTLSAYETRVSDGVAATLGVRYATRRDPADRFSDLTDPEPHLLQEEPAAFPQAPGSMDWLLGTALARMPQHEDAFQLNIWAPEGARNAPVLVFVPGGAYVSGAGTVGWYDGRRLAGEGGVVVVTVNYRLGALGLIGRDGRDGLENRGIADVLAALQWIRDNIAGFGGDPEQVTLAGQSAGAWIALALAQAEAARGLFRRAALYSLPFQPPLSREEARERAAIFHGAVGVSPAEAGMGDLLAAQGAVARAYAGRGLGLQPVADGQLVPADLGDFTAVAGRLHVEGLLLSSNDDEAAAMLHGLPVPAVSAEMADGFIAAHFGDPAEAGRVIDGRLPGATPHARMVEAMSLHQFRLAATELAAAADAAGIPATLLRFSVRSALPGAGCAHNFELPFLFGNPERWTDAPMLDGFAPEAFEASSADVRSLLLGFVRSGTARDAAGNQAPSFDPAQPRMLRLDGSGAASAVPESGLLPRR